MGKSGRTTQRNGTGAELAWVEDCEAAERHVHDRPVGLGAKPLEAPGVLRQELPDGLPELPVRGQESDGQDVGRRELERAGLDLAERVAHHHLGEGGEPDGLDVQLEDDRVRLGRDDVHPRQLRHVQGGIQGASWNVSSRSGQPVARDAATLVKQLLRC